MTPYLGQVLLAGFNFAPKGWALCQAQLLPINQNQALFSILGTYYGGNGIQTFALPDLRGRTPIHWGQGPGLANYSMGEQTGQISTTLVASNLPLHTHPLNATTTGGNAPTPAGNLVGTSPVAQTGAIYGSPANTTMAPTMVANAGNNQPVSIMQPYTCINFVVALQGIFPTRN